MPVAVVLWLVVALALTCAGLCWALEAATTLHVALLDLYDHVRPGTAVARYRVWWGLWRRLWRVFCGLFVLIAAAYAGVALRWW